MNWESLVKPEVLRKPVYEPGKPIEDVARELGIDPSGIIKLASNENPYGPSPRAVEAAKKALDQGQLYPDGGCYALRQKLAARLGLAPDQFIVGNGSNEILEFLAYAFLRPGDEVLMGAPAFIVYKLATLLCGATPVEVPLKEHAHDLGAMARAVTPRTRLVFVASPNNPTGVANPEKDLLAFARGLPEDAILAMDEAYIEFQENPPDLRCLIGEGRKVVFLRTFSKIYGLASLRVGYGYASRELIALLNRVRQPFNVNAIGQAAAVAALDDEGFIRDYAANNRRGMAQLQAGARALGLDYVPSEANFLLIRVGEGQRWFEELQSRGVIVRPLKPYGMPEWLRVTVGTPAQNERVLAELARLSAGKR
jgi:histidinol-phosphate aminotransferase